MKLKEIYFESKDLEKLGREIDSGNWIVKEPYLYRGQDPKHRLQKKHTSEGRRTMSWEFPDERITQFFFDVEDECYPNHPKHRNSRHCTTVRRYAGTYGDNVYVILPSKNATIGYFRKTDIVVNLFTNDQIFDDLEFIYNQKEKIFKNYRSMWIDLYQYFVKGKDISIMNKYGCLGKLIKRIEKSRGKLYSGESTFDLESRMRGVYTKLSRVYDFFEYKFKPKYPPSVSNYGDEVLVEGDILKVHTDIWDRYWELEERMK